MNYTWIQRNVLGYSGPCLGLSISYSTSYFSPSSLPPSPSLSVFTDVFILLLWNALLDIVFNAGLLICIALSSALFARYH